MFGLLLVGGRLDGDGGVDARVLVHVPVCALGNTGPIACVNTAMFAPAALAQLAPVSDVNRSLPACSYPSYRGGSWDVREAGP